MVIEDAGGAAYDGQARILEGKGESVPDKPFL